MARGILSGHAVVDIHATVDDGSFHNVDSSEAAFIMAGILGFTAAARQANPVILEPIWELVVTAPEGATGTLMGDLSSRRGQVLGMEAAERKGYQTLRAHVPMSEVQRYAVDLRSLAHGRGTFTVTHAHYAPLPPNLAAPLIAEYEKRKAEGSHGHD
jgi:elongation factor G